MKRAFTLIEFTTVIVVMSLLVLISLPLLGKGRASAKNATIDQFLHDCHRVYVQLSYGEPPSYTVTTNEVSYSAFNATTTLGTVILRYSPPKTLTITGLPTTFFKNGLPSFTVNYGNNTYNTLTQEDFLALVKW